MSLDESMGSTAVLAPTAGRSPQPQLRRARFLARFHPWQIARSYLRFFILYFGGTIVFTFIACAFRIAGAKSSHEAALFSALALPPLAAAFAFILALHLKDLLATQTAFLMPNANRNHLRFVAVLCLLAAILALLVIAPNSSDAFVGLSALVLTGFTIGALLGHFSPAVGFAGFALLGFAPAILLRLNPHSVPSGLVSIPVASLLTLVSLGSIGLLARRILLLREEFPEYARRLPFNRFEIAARMRGGPSAWHNIGPSFRIPSLAEDLVLRGWSRGEGLGSIGSRALRVASVSRLDAAALLGGLYVAALIIVLFLFFRMIPRTPTTLLSFSGSVWSAFIVFANQQGGRHTLASEMLRPWTRSQFLAANALAIGAACLLNWLVVTTALLVVEGIWFSGDFADGTPYRLVILSAAELPVFIGLFACVTRWCGPAWVSALGGGLGFLSFMGHPPVATAIASLSSPWFWSLNLFLAIAGLALCTVAYRSWLAGNIDDH